MAIKHPNANGPNSKIEKGSASAPKARVGQARKPARLRGFSPLPLGQCWPRHWPRQPGPEFGQPGPFPEPSGSAFGPPYAQSLQLGPPMLIADTAELIGCSPWTVRQTLLRRGLPHFRSGASGRLIFYRDQVIRWIESQQQGGTTTK